jgi:hypothetical protein
MTIMNLNLSQVLLLASVRRVDLDAKTQRRWGRANSPQKLARPGSGPPAEPARSAVFERRHAARIARFKCGQAACRAAVATWALAVQLSVRSVGRTGRAATRSVRTVKPRHDSENREYRGPPTQHTEPEPAADPSATCELATASQSPRGLRREKRSLFVRQAPRSDSLLQRCLATRCLKFRRSPASG